MPFSIIFEDDEHTAADGGYVRMLKARKWLYLTAALTFLLHFGLINVTALNNLLAVVRLDANLMRHFVLGSLLYLLFQYLLIGFQVIRSYDIILRERFWAKQTSQIEAINEQVKSNLKEQEQYQRQIFHADAIPVDQRKPYESARTFLSDRQSALADLEKKREAVRKESLGSRRSLVFAEAIIDAQRGAVPALVALVVLGLAFSGPARTTIASPDPTTAAAAQPAPPGARASAPPAPQLAALRSAPAAAPP